MTRLRLRSLYSHWPSAPAASIVRATAPDHPTTRMRLRTLIAAATVALPTTAAGQPIRWQPCEPAVAHARCGTLAVPESRDGPGGRTIDLAFALLPATGAARDGAPLLVLLGGPGDTALDRLPSLASTFATMNRTRDVVVVDQRGTGRSAPLRCAFADDADAQSYLDAFLPLHATRECGARLGAHADLARYRTRDFVADLEALRGALGVDRWTLHGRSYGTRVALHYLQRHPARVRAAVLQGVVPPELAMPRTIGADADTALAMLAADCRADAACTTAFPHFRAEVDSIAARLARAPATVAFTNPFTRRADTVSLTRAVFGETVRSLMYTPFGASMLPLTIHEAYGGDYRPIVLAALGTRRGLARSGVAGLYLSVTCAEDVARVEAAAAVAHNEATTMGSARARQHIAACEGWPVRPDGEEWPTAPQSVRVPVLLLVGETDPATPPHWAEVALRTLPNARLVVVPQGAHGFAGMLGAACIDRVQAAFVDAPEPGAVDVTCVAAMRRRPFVLRR